jgi:hypothetical protein
VKNGSNPIEVFFHPYCRANFATSAIEVVVSVPVNPGGGR